MFILLLGGAVPALAQVQGILGKRFSNNWSIGIGGGPVIFFGDLKVKRLLPVTSDMNEVKFGGTFTLTKQLSHLFAIRGQFLYSELSGTKRQKKYGAPYNQYFDGNIMGGNLNATLNLSNLLASRDKPHRRFFLYLTAGIGATSWNSNVKELGTGIPLRKSDTLGNWNTALSVMGGLGAYFSIHDKVNIGLECTDHLVNTDMIDATPEGFKFDACVMLSLNITYNFNKYNPRKLPFVGPPAPQVTVVPPVPQAKPADTTPPPPERKKDTAKAVPAPAPVAPPVKPAVKPSPAIPPATGLTFRVQVFAFQTDRHTLLQIRDKYFPGEEVFKDYSGGWYRFTVGNFTTPEAAKAKLAQLQKRGFKDAFITRYKNGTRIPPPYGKN